MVKLLSEQSQTPKNEDKVDKALQSLKTAIISQSKAEGKDPSYVFGLRIADGVKNNWNNGKIPTVDQLKTELHALSSPSKDITASSLINLGVKATLLGHILDLAEKNKAKTKKEKPEIPADELNRQKDNFVKGIYEVASERKAEHERKQQAKKQSSQ